MVSYTGYHIDLQDISFSSYFKLSSCFFLLQSDEEKLDERAKMSVAAKRSLFRVRFLQFSFRSIFLIKVEPFSYA